MWLAKTNHCISKFILKDNDLVVENNLQKKEVLQDRKGVGLQNIVSRYAILSPTKSVGRRNKEIIWNLPSNFNKTNQVYGNIKYIQRKHRLFKS